MLVDVTRPAQAQQAVRVVRVVFRPGLAQQHDMVMSLERPSPSAALTAPFCAFQDRPADQLPALLIQGLGEICSCRLSDEPERPPGSFPRPCQVDLGQAGRDDRCLQHVNPAFAVGLVERRVCQRPCGFIVQGAIRRRGVFAPVDVRQVLTGLDLFEQGRIALDRYGDESAVPTGEGAFDAVDQRPSALDRQAQRVEDRQVISAWLPEVAGLAA